VCSHRRPSGPRFRSGPLEPRHASPAFVRRARALERLELNVRATSLTLPDELAGATIGRTFNQYAASPLLRERLRTYLHERSDAPFLLVGEAAGYRGARISGIPFTSERQLTGTGAAEATATVVHRVLAELELAEDVLLWNVVPTHPGTAASNRRPTRAEIAAAAPFLAALTSRSRHVVAVGRVAAAATGAPYVRHPSHGGAAAFRAGLAAATIRRPRTRVRRIHA
jgi:uracil-DNA glycosylase